MIKNINEDSIKKAIRNSLKRYVMKEEINNLDNDNTGNVNIDDLLGGDDFDYTQFGEPDEDSLESKFYERLFEAIDAASRNIDGVIWLLDHCDSYDFDEETAELKIIRKNVNHIFDRLNNIMKDYDEEI